jgi:hypothetical protein
VWQCKVISLSIYSNHNNCYLLSLEWLKGSFVL